MTQVTNEMVAVALEAHANAPTIVDEVTAEGAMRSALEAALAARQAPHIPGMRDQTADYLRRHKDACDRYEKVRVLTEERDAALVENGALKAVRDIELAERAELIEALRPFVYDLPYFGIRSDMDEVRRARALIERQAEEIAELKADIILKWSELEGAAGIISGFTAERAELIEALRPMAVDMGDPNWDDMGLAELELTLGDCRRACALLERLGAKEVG